MAAAASSPASSRWRPLLEVLRAPLLLSPISDVVAGWALVSLAARSAGAPATTATSLATLLATCLAGCCLLGAGMAQNALADRDDDRRRKPDRPLPRGAVSLTLVRRTFLALTAIPLIVAFAVPALWPLVTAIIVITALYHYVLKPYRIAGCLALGTLRALDMALGVVAASAATGSAATAFSDTLPLVVCCGYGFYIAGASLHASTDDEPGPAPWSRRGLALCLGLMGALTLLLVTRLGSDPWHQGGALAVLLFAGWRLVTGWRRLPPPAITGVALSNLYLIGVTIAWSAGQLVAGLVLLALFRGSRLMLRVFPPS